MCRREPGEKACFLIFSLLPFLKGLSNGRLCGSERVRHDDFKNVVRYVAAKCGGHNLNGFEVIHFSSRGRFQTPPPPLGLNRVNQF